MARRHIEINAVASAGTHFAGQHADERQPHPLPEVEAMKYLVLGVLDGGMNRFRRGTWRQLRTSRSTCAAQCNAKTPAWRAVLGGTVAHCAAARCVASSVPAWQCGGAVRLRS